MAFGTVQAISPRQIGKAIEPMSSLARVGVVINDLKAAAASAAQMRNPVSAALAQMNIVDARGTRLFRAYGRATIGTSLSFSTRPKVALFGVFTDGEPIFNTSGVITGFSKTVDHIERLDQAGSTLDGGLTVPFAASPTISNSLNNGTWLYTEALTWTDVNGNVRDYFNSHGAAFILGCNTLAGIGTPIANEQSQLVLAGIN